jgi:hypothetical protein
MGYRRTTSDPDRRVCGREDSLNGFGGQISVFPAAGGFYDDLGDEHTTSWLNNIFRDPRRLGTQFHSVTEQIQPDHQRFVQLLIVGVVRVDLEIRNIGGPS